MAVFGEIRLSATDHQIVVSYGGTGSALATCPPPFAAPWKLCEHLWGSTGFAAPVRVGDAQVNRNDVGGSSLGAVG